MAPGRGRGSRENKGFLGRGREEGSNVFVRLDKIEVAKGLFIHIPSVFQGPLVGMKLAFAKGAFRAPFRGSISQRRSKR